MRSDNNAGSHVIVNVHKPVNGTISIDGQDINQVSLDSLRDNICMVGQSPNLKNGTIRDNIKFGARNPDAVSDAMIMALAEELNLVDFIDSLSDHLDTDIGENGAKLSGGQQQKTAILRGFFKKAPILLLDEVTASLDAGSAAAVLDGIKGRFLNDTTTLIITHKLKEITFADKIVLLDKGAVLAEGTHNELLGNCPLYQTLWAKQFEDKYELINDQCDEDDTQGLEQVLFKNM